ncbi:Fn3 domain-containing protein [Orenia metallireducens]|uniref:Fn3 associated n=1 Tax=Orenia metallireducens TaxID=1413210 RepID=A0A285I273_9FIRM|nr:DUF499 domain-containing protein [Orenia metallireducens]PRX23246.1 Fn3 domain-containing protein [Orenia metallireducens]SNY42065.1 Fn3 associated [Orenia metallireducens]
MKKLNKAVKVRESVYSKEMKDEVLDLSDLRNDSINAERFFEETFITENMEILFDTAMNKFRNRSGNSIIKLTQAMGGGKTHNMIALGLLAQNPELRRKILDGKYNDVEGKIRTVSITGRESDMEFGTWGEIAKQLKRKELFNEYYSPLKAPGQTAWINLLESSTPTLILLDELPPYLNNAKTREYGQGTLLDIETTAIANLLNAINKKELSNVCLVISDLEATYEEESEVIKGMFKELDGEISRFSLNLEPVSSNTNDLYEILKTRMFEELPSEAEIEKVVKGYRKSIKEAVEMGYTDEIPSEFSSMIRDTYPFHPSFKELVERFKENQGFQKTRGVIRLTKKMLKGIFKDSDKAASNYLINPYDINLNDSEMANEIKSIKPEFVNAISHDIASNGHAVAERLDKLAESEDIQNVAKLILMSSLSKATEAIIGLSINEIFTYLAGPDNDITKIRSGIDELQQRAWYLYKHHNKLLFRQTKNIVAEMQDEIKNISREQSKLYIKGLLKEHFEPVAKDCYQKLMVFPSIEEITLDKNKITLIIAEPSDDSDGLKKELHQFYEECEYKNRVMFLTGQKNVMNNLLEVGKRVKAIKSIITRMQADNVSERDSEMQQGLTLRDKSAARLYSNLRETFTTIYYPRSKRLKNKNLTMKFAQNNFNAEKEVAQTLEEEMKFTRDIEPDKLRRRFNKVIFTRDRMTWNELMERTATETNWLWHKPSALNDLKEDSLHKEIWFEDGNYIDSTPPAKITSVNINEINREDDGTVMLQLSPMNADKVLYEIGEEPGDASKAIDNLSAFKAEELVYYFLAIDSSGVSETGEAIRWENDIDLKYKEFTKDGHDYMELEASTNDCEIKYTTDGSSPEANGGVYKEAFRIPKGAKFIQAIAINQKYDIRSEVLQYKVKDVEVTIDMDKSVKLNRDLRPSGTKYTYEALKFLKETDASIEKLQVIVNGRGGEQFSITLTVNNMEIDDMDIIEDELKNITNNLIQGKKYDINAIIDGIRFKRGRDFQNWLTKNGFNLKEFKNKFYQS